MFCCCLIGTFIVYAQILQPIECVCLCECGSISSAGHIYLPSHKFVSHSLFHSWFFPRFSLGSSRSDDYNKWCAMTWIITRTYAHLIFDCAQLKYVDLFRPVQSLVARTQSSSFSFGQSLPCANSWIKLSSIKSQRASSRALSSVPFHSNRFVIHIK